MHPHPLATGLLVFANTEALPLNPAAAVIQDVRGWTPLYALWWFTAHYVAAAANCALSNKITARPTSVYRSTHRQLMQI
jgi:hypothetical protein